MWLLLVSFLISTSYSQTTTLVACKQGNRGGEQAFVMSLPRPNDFNLSADWNLSRVGATEISLTTGGSQHIGFSNYRAESVTLVDAGLQILFSGRGRINAYRYTLLVPRSLNSQDFSVTTVTRVPLTGPGRVTEASNRVRRRPGRQVAVEQTHTETLFQSRGCGNSEEQQSPQCLLCRAAWDQLDRVLTPTSH